MSFENPNIDNSLEGDDIKNFNKNEKKRPSKKLTIRPIEIEGKFYDPDNPPKLFEDSDGKKNYKGGKEISRDEAYSMMFWSKEKPDSLKDTMKDILNGSFKTGVISIFAGAEKHENGFELEQESKEKLSAYRILAEELGYIIGPYKYNEKSGNVQATINKTKREIN
jgi:hypothetical protein